MTAIAVNCLDTDASFDRVSGLFLVNEPAPVPNASR